MLLEMGSLGSLSSHMFTRVNVRARPSCVFSFPSRSDFGQVGVIYTQRASRLALLWMDGGYLLTDSRGNRHKEADLEGQETLLPALGSGSTEHSSLLRVT